MTQNELAEKLNVTDRTISKCENDKIKVLDIIKENGFELLYSNYKIFDDVDIFNYFNNYECKSIYQSNIVKYFINRLYNDSNNKEIIKNIYEKYIDVCGNKYRYAYSSGYYEIDRQINGLVEGKILIIKSKKIYISKLLASSIADYFISNNADYNLYIYSSKSTLDECLCSVGNKLIIFEVTSLKEIKQIQEIITKIKEKDKNSFLLFMIYTTYKNVNNIEDVSGIIEMSVDKYYDQNEFEQVSINSDCLYHCNVINSRYLKNTTSFDLFYHNGKLFNVINRE